MNFFLLILPVFCISAHQLSDPNCLRANPGALDADFALLNRYEKIEEIMKEDVQKHVALFSTRFNRAHSFRSLNSDMVKLIREGVSLYTKSSKKDIQLYLRANDPANQSDEIEVIRQLTEDYEAVMRINSDDVRRPVIGLYLPSSLVPSDANLKSVKSVFGSKEHSRFPLGSAFEDCSAYFKSQEAALFLQQMDFISCQIIPLKKSSPEESADDVVKKCDQIRDVATSINLSAEITCLVGYPSYGITTGGVVASVSDFQEFWCRIVNKVIKDKSHPKIVMWSAFDDPPGDYKDDETDLHDQAYHRGWWRRRDTISYETSAFVEKVDELEGGREHGKRGEICSFCNSSEECGTGKACSTDYSFQPIENGDARQVCKSSSTTCAPRTPASLRKTPNGKSDSVVVSVRIVFFIACSTASSLFFQLLI